MRSIWRGARLALCWTCVATGSWGQTLSAVVTGDLGDGAAAATAILGMPSGLAVDGEGNLFVADAAHHRIRRVDAVTGVITTVAGTGRSGSDGDGGPAVSARLTEPRGLAVDDGGNLYIADPGAGVLRRVDPSGQITTVLGLAGTATPSSPYRDVDVGADGSLYVADLGTDATGGRILRVDGASGTVTYLAGTGVAGFSGDNGPATSAQVSGPDGIGVDADGNVYFLDRGNWRVRRIEALTGIITTVAGNGSFGFTDEGAPAVFLSIGAEGLDVDDAGNLYLAENTVVRRVDAVSGLMTRVAGEGSNGGSGDGGPALAARFDGISAVLADDAGNVWAAAERNNAVRRIDAASGTVETVVGTGIGDGAAAAQASLLQPSRLALGADGSIYIADAWHHRIRRYDPSADTLATVAGLGGISFHGDGGPAVDAYLANPLGVAADGDGNLYIADTWSNRVRRVDGITGVITSVVGSGPSFQSGPAYNGDGMAATSAWISWPADVAVADGYLYLSDSGNHRVRRVDLSTMIIETVAGTGAASSLGDGGAATAASVHSPTGLFVDTTGDLYIADTGGHRIRRVRPDGVISTVAGLGVAGFAGDGGSALAARLDAPEDVVVDASGNLYVADTGNHVVRRVDAATGTITTIAGDGQDGFDGIGGIPDQARLGAPAGLLIDAAGNLYVADRANHALLRVASDNTAPQLTVTGALNGAEGQTLTLDVAASDPDGDAVTLGARNLPAGATFADGRFVWTPGYAAQGSYDVTFTVADERGGSARYTVTLVITDVLSLTASSVDFGRVFVDSVGLRTVDVVNDGSVSLTLEATVASPFAVSPVTLTVPAGGSQQLSVRFAPGAAGSSAAGVSLRLDGSDTGLRLALSGEGRLPGVSVSPSALDFGQVATGASASAVLTITNAGSQSLRVSNIIPGDAQYSVSTSAFTLNPGSSRDVSVTFVPIQGRSAASTLTILTSDADFPVLSVPLSAATASSAPPVIAVLPSTLNFGSVSLGQTRSLTLFVSNSGGGSLRLLNIVASSADITVSESAFLLAAGQEKALTLTLQPTRLGSLSETLDLPSNDPATPFLQIPLRATVGSGTGQPSLDLSVTLLDFGQVAEGETSRFTVPVRNTGSATLSVSNAVSDNTQVVPSPTSLSVPPQETRSLTVSFHPLPGRGRSGAVTLFTNDPLQPIVDLVWNAADVASPFLQLAGVSPADGSFAVPTETDIELRFSEPLFYRRGFTALDVELRPEPLSGPLVDDLDVRGDGSIVDLPVQLADDTVYRLVVYGATGRSGLELFDIQEFTFSTGASAPVFGSLSGLVTADAEGGIEGSVYLYDAEAHLVSQAAIALDGSFVLEGLPEGSYRLYADGSVADGRSLGGAYDSDGDGAADLITLQSGDVLDGLELAATLRDVPDAEEGGTRLLVDLDGRPGNQRLATRWQTTAGDSIVLEVYVEDVTQLTGSAVEVTFDTAAVALVGVEPGDHLLHSGGGTDLYLSHMDPLAGTIEFGGSVLGPTEATAVTGSGLLGRFRFQALMPFPSASDLTVTGVTLKSLDARLRLEPSLAARLSTEAGPAPSPIHLDLDTRTGDQQQDVAGGAAAGRSYTVQLHVSDAPAIDGWSATIEYDPQQVTYVAGSFVPSSFISGLLPLVNATTGRVSVGGVALGVSSSASGDGQLGALSFQVLDGFSGSTTLTLNRVSLNTVDAGEQIQAVEERVELTSRAVDGGLPGDFNGDGAVDFSDFFIFADGFGTSQAAYDLSGDGVVDFSDFFIFADSFGLAGQGKLMALARQLLGLPAQSALLRAYPNPFNGQVSIPFELDRSQGVSLLVYDLAGQRVRTLHRGDLPAGPHLLSWEADDDEGRSVASGVYIVRLSTPEVQQARRILLLR